MPRVGFEPTISADERPKTYALDRAATGTGSITHCFMKILAIVRPFPALVIRYLTSNEASHAFSLMLPPV